VITPAALALSDQRPRDTGEQKWLLVLTGCLPCSVSWPPPGSTDREAPAGSQFIAFRPDIKNPCLYAINHYGVPRPAGAEGADYRVEFKIEQCASFVGVVMSEITPAADWQSTTGIINWFPTAGWGREVSSGGQIRELFKGIEVQCLADKAGALLAISYHITLIGNIVFIQIPLDELRPSRWLAPG
jgi:hypothetical protein